MTCSEVGWPLSRVKDVPAQEVGIDNLRSSLTAQTILQFCDKVAFIRILHFPQMLSLQTLRLYIDFYIILVLPSIYTHISPHIYASVDSECKES